METLVRQIREQIQQSGGWIGFDAFMQAALYSPGLGYYSGGGQPFAEQPSQQGGDFVTGPMLGPWIGRAIWQWAQPLRGQRSSMALMPDPLKIREFGGGRGDLAAELLRAAPPQAIEMEMVELSADLQRAQRQATSGLGRVQWISSLEPGFKGLVIANEVLDAMPVKCFEWAGRQEVLEWGVGLAEGADQAASDTGLAWVAQPAGHLLADVVLERKEAAAARGLPWDVGYRGEWCPWFGPWLRAVFEAMAHGAVLLIDYGFAQPELDQPGRTHGTLCAHWRHQRIDAPRELLNRIGQQDLTAHVDFTHVAGLAKSMGFGVDGFVTQARFLMNSGLLEIAQPMLEATQDLAQKTRLLQSLQTLMSESEMGEVFKVLLLTKGLDESQRQALIQGGFAQGDRLGSISPLAG